MRFIKKLEYRNLTHRLRRSPLPKGECLRFTLAQYLVMTIPHRFVTAYLLRARAPQGLTVHRTVIQDPRFRFSTPKGSVGNSVPRLLLSFYFAPQKGINIDIYIVSSDVIIV